MSLDMKNTSSLAGKLGKQSRTPLAVAIGEYIRSLVDPSYDIDPSMLHRLQPYREQTAAIMDDSKPTILTSPSLTVQPPEARQSANDDIGDTGKKIGTHG